MKITDSSTATVTWLWRTGFTALLSISIYANKITQESAINKAIRSVEISNDLKFLSYKSFEDWREAHKDWSAQVISRLDLRMSGIEKICIESHDELMKLKFRP